MNSQFQDTKTWIALAIMALFMIPRFTLADSANGRVNPFARTVASHSSPMDDRDGAVARANELSAAFRTASSKVLPSLVAIETRAEATRFRGGGPSNPFAPSGGMQPAVGMGSGVIVDPSGIILTNNHVVMNGMGQVTVRLSDGREFRAIEVLTDPKADIAVVRIEGVGDLLASPMGNSDRSEIGDWVLALGQPFGLESTVTAGIISAKQRGIGVNERESYIQTDAAINPGNSGGPLVNLNGEVIGINTAISSRSGGNEGIGFAIPINQARWIGNQLMEHGKVRRSYMGVGVQELTAPLATQFGVPPRSGLVVTLVQPDSPADRAGLQTGDVLVSFDGSPVNEPAELQLIVERCEPGQKKSLEILRGAEHSRLSVVPAELVDDVAVDEVREAAVPVAVQPTSEIGLRVEAIDPEIAQQTGISDGVVVTAIAIGSPAQQAGLEPGVVISEVNHQRIRGIEDFATAIRRADPSSGILMLVEGPEGSRYLVLKTAS